MYDLPQMGKYKGVYEMDKDIITNFENLYRAYKKAKLGKSHNGSCARFQNMSLEGIHLLKEQLENQTYQIGKYSQFKICEPKERVIMSCSFKDKVVQHCLCDNILHPRLQNVFIETNSAGQVGKGTLFGMDKLKEQMLAFYREHRIDGWILKCDIAKFFYSINHEVLKDIVDYYFPNSYTTWLNHLFIDSTNGFGLPLGNQVAQVYALMMLDCIDHMITGELGIRYYGRYMDDFYLIHYDKSYLKYCLLYIEEMVSSLGLSLNGKTQICPFKNGIRYLGFHHYMTKDGKYIRRLNSENKRRAKKKVRNMLRLLKARKISEKEFQNKYGSWKNHASHGNTVKLVHSMDLHIKSEIEKG